MSCKALIQSALLVFCFTFLRSQTYHFSNYSVKDGLAQSNVSGIVQDTAGFYWIATAGGVSRFDGKNFVNYTTENGLTDNNVSTIFVDKDHQLWLGHENGSLTKFDGQQFVEIKSKLLPNDKKIFGMYQDKGGSLWVCTETAGVIRIVEAAPQKGGHQTRVYSAKEGLSPMVLSATEDKRGDMWFLLDVGIKVMDKTTRTFDFFRPENFSLGYVTFLSSDNDGNLIFGNYSGAVLSYDPVQKKFGTLISQQQISELLGGFGPFIIHTIHQDRHGNIWASIANYGVVRLEKSSGKLTLFNTSNGISVNKVKCIFEDREGNIVLGTSGEGIDVFSGERFVSYSKNNGVLDNQVWAICKDKYDRAWFGTNGGITVYDEKAPKNAAYKNLTVAEGLTSNNVRAIAEDHNNDLWIATWGGKVLKYNMQSSRFEQIQALNDIVNVFAGALMVDRRNYLWIGTNEGIVRYHIPTQEIRTMRTIDGLSDNYISCLFEDSKGRVWIGTNQKGVTMFDGKNFKIFNRQNGLNYNSISSFAEDGQHNIWIGTEGGGAFVYDGNKFRNYKIKDGLASDFVTLLQLDKNNKMWLGTNKGLNKFDAATGKFYTYDQSNGFTGVETKPRASYMESDGKMWFGTVNGAYKYSPALDQPVTVKPITKILRFRVNNRDYDFSDNIELSYKDNSLEFEFIGISLSSPQSVHYQVSLTGNDDTLRSKSGQTSTLYSNLLPGKYQFNLVACNSSGVCSDPLIMRIEITPPYYKTWWFYLIVLSVIVSGLFTYIKIRERSLRLEKKILEDKVNERTAEVVEKNKELDEINKDITASIRYAKRIQDAILPPDEYVKAHLPNTFILFKPKDIVSGDFYWMEDRNDSVIFAAVDCTGHGVPGAFMSIVGHNLLDRVVGENHIYEPARILDELNRSISETLRQSTLEDNTVRDGMDIAMCSFSRKTGILQFAGAYNPLWLIRGGEFIEIKANKFPIGNTRLGDTHKFTNHELPLQKGDTVYIFSDGYCDQFGGPAGKKFKASALRQLLLANQHLNMAEQHRLLNETIEQWRGSHEQVDDILIIGSRYE